MDHLVAVAQQFAPAGQILEVREYGSGNVNDTYLVAVGGEHPTLPALEAVGATRFILQRLNLRVFPRPDLVMGNLGAVTAHVRRRLRANPLALRWEIPRVLRARDGRDHYLDAEGSFWRALSFIEGARTFDTVQDAGHAGEVGYALGRFHHLLSDLPAARLADTLPGFHVTPGYLKHFDEVLVRSGAPSSPEAAYALRAVAAGRGRAAVLEEAKAQGILPLRPIHGDPKVNNVMLDAASGQAVALVDLDTVKPGLVHYDIGDCLRSGGNPLGEETENWEEVYFDPGICRAVLSGYLSQTRGFLVAADYDYLYDAIGLLAFELGLRFFTDYLEGNVYFKARHREHNLRRALVQFRLADSIASQEKVIRVLIRDKVPVR